MELRVGSFSEDGVASCERSISATGGEEIGESDVFYTRDEIVEVLYATNFRFSIQSEDAPPVGGRWSSLGRRTMAPVRTVSAAG